MSLPTLSTISLSTLSTTSLPSCLVSLFVISVLVPEPTPCQGFKIISWARDKASNFKHDYHCLFLISMIILINTMMILILAKVLKLPAEQFKHDYHYLLLVTMIILINTMIILIRTNSLPRFLLPKTSCSQRGTRPRSRVRYKSLICCDWSAQSLIQMLKAVFPKKRKF